MIWVKNGSDKRKVNSNEALLRLLQSSGNIIADEEVLFNTSINNIDETIFKEFILKKTGQRIEELNLTIPQLLNNMSFAVDEHLTLAGLLFFANLPQSIKPLFTVHCISFLGNDKTALEFRDSEPPFEGNLKTLYHKTMNFIIRNLKKIQKEISINSLGVMEIPRETIEEFVVNALIHRDYFIKTTIKVFIFDDRIEIISPGILPNSLTIDKIKSGTSVIRNPILYTNARYLLPFLGIGSGIPRAIATYPKIDLYNREDQEQFVVVLHRP